MVSMNTTVIYRVRGTRVTNGKAETVTELRRVWPAAVRLAERWQEWGRDPVTIEAVVVIENRWLAVWP
jgi:hypothetical protein